MENVNFAKLMLLLADAQVVAESEEAKQKIKECKDELLVQMKNIQDNKKALVDVWNNL